MKNKNKIHIIILCLLIIPMFGCGDSETVSTPAPTEVVNSAHIENEDVSAQSQPTTPSSSGDASSTQSPCDLDFDHVGEYVKVKGLVMFVDDTAPDVLYADLEEGMCRIGIVIAKSNFSTWNEEEKKAFNVGSEIMVSGSLASYPMPFQPEQEQLVIEIDLAPQLIFGAAASPNQLDDTLGDPCLFPSELVGKEVEASGDILFVDDGTAAGLYAEMQSDDCVYRLWVERTRWDTWSDGEKEIFSMGNSVDVKGILTIVLNDQNIDLIFPPTPQTE